MSYRTDTSSVCRRVRASFSPDIVQAGEVKGLYRVSDLCGWCFGGTNDGGGEWGASYTHYLERVATTHHLEMFAKCIDQVCSAELAVGEFTVSKQITRNG